MALGCENQTFDSAKAPVTRLGSIMGSIQSNNGDRYWRITYADHERVKRNFFRRGSFQEFLHRKSWLTPCVDFRDVVCIRCTFSCRDLWPGNPCTPILCRNKLLHLKFSAPINKMRWEMTTNQINSSRQLKRGAAVDTKDGDVAKCQLVASSRFFQKRELIRWNHQRNVLF